MAYEKQIWNQYDDLKTEEENIENGAVVTDNRMNHIEEGIGQTDTSLQSHLADKTNPHGVTAEQVGAYSKDESDQKLATQKQAIDSHVNNKSNPHAVTASQVGAYTKSESDSKLTDLSNKAILNKGNIASGTDLNSVTDTGYYRIEGLLGGTDILNVPSEVSGIRFYAFLTVIGSLQELTFYAPIKDTTWTYSRSLSGDPAAWSVWSKTVMADDYGKVTVKDLNVNGKISDLGMSNFTPRTATWSSNGINIAFTRVGPLVVGTWGGSQSNIAQGFTYTTPVPSGFRPNAQAKLLVIQSDVSNFNIDTNGTVKYWGLPATSGNLSGMLAYFTNDPFPAS